MAQRPKDQARDPQPSKGNPAITPAVIGTYLLRKKLGAGAAGEVFLAHDRLLDRDVALKLLRPEIAENETRLREFLKEARAAAKLNHPNIVTVYQVDKKDGKVFIAMEYVPGGSLADEIKTNGALPWREATLAIRDAAAGMAAAHEAGIVHRDIKPGNLMRASRGLVKVADFGLAHVETADPEVTQTMVGVIMGSPGYMSPEQCRGERTDARSDLYSLTCTYYQLLTRQLPFSATNLPMLVHQHCHDPFPDGPLPNVPDGVRRIMARGSQKNREERYQSAQSLLDDLEALLATPEVSHTFDGRKTGPASPLSIAGARAGAGKSAAPAVTKPGRPGLLSLLKGQGVAGKLAWLGLATVIAIVGLALFHFMGPGHHGDGDRSVAGDTPLVAPTPGQDNGGSHGADHLSTTAPPSASVASGSHNPPPAAKSTTAPASMEIRFFDLMPLIDPRRDAAQGTWAMAGPGLQNQPVPGGVQVIRMPWTPGDADEFDLHIGFVFKEEGAGFRTLISHGGKRFDISIDQKGAYGIGDILKPGDAQRSRAGGKLSGGLESRVHHECVIRVRAGVQDVCLDGRRVVHHSGYTDLAENEVVKRSDDALSIAGWGAGEYSPIEIIAVKGSGTFLRGSASPPGAPPLSVADPHRQNPGLVRAVTILSNLQSARLAPGGRRLCFCTKDTSPSGVNIMDLETGMHVPFVGEGTFCEILPDGRRMLTEFKGKFRIFDLETGQEMLALGTPGKTSLVTPDVAWVLTLNGSPSDHPALFNLNTGAESGLADLPTQAPRALAPNGEAFAAETKDHHLHVWDTRTSKELWQAPDTHSRAQVTFSADGRVLLVRRTSSAKLPVDLLDAASGDVLARCGGWAGRCTCAALSTDGQLLVAGCDDATNGVRLFLLEGEQKKLTATLADWPAGAKEIGSVNAVAFSPDNRRVLVGCVNHRVRLIDVASGKEVANFDHGGEVMQVGFSSDNRYAVSGNDTSIRVWRLPNPTSSGGHPATAPVPPPPVVVVAHPATHPSAAPVSPAVVEAHPTTRPSVTPAPPHPKPQTVANTGHPATAPAVSAHPATHPSATPAQQHAQLASEAAALEDSLKQATSLDAFTRVTTDGFALLDRAAAAKDSETIDAVEKLIRTAAIESKDIQLGLDVKDQLRQFDSRAGRANAPQP